MWHDGARCAGDEGLWRSVVHNTTHLILSNQKLEVWLGNRKYGWIDEGVAHWFEDLVTQKCTNFCYEEVALQYGCVVQGRALARRRAQARRRGKVHTFAELASATPTSSLRGARVRVRVRRLPDGQARRQEVCGAGCAPRRAASSRATRCRRSTTQPVPVRRAVLGLVKATYPTEEKHERLAGARRGRCSRRVRRAGPADRSARAYARILELRTELVRCWVSRAPLRARDPARAGERCEGQPVPCRSRARWPRRAGRVRRRVLFRTAIHCFALPEVVDPVEFKELAVTMHMRSGCRGPGRAVRHRRQEGGPGAPAPLAVIEQDTGRDDLERFRAVAKVPVRAARPPRDRAGHQHDRRRAAARRRSRADAPVRVIPGYSARAKSLSAERRSLEGKAAADDLAVLDGALSAVERVWTGEPRGGLFDARTDLEACERMLANVVEGRPICSASGRANATTGPGLHDRPGAGEGRSWTCTLDGRPASGRLDASVVVVPGTPTWPTHLGAPSSPEATPPGFVWSQLDAAGLPQALAGRAAAVVVLESPGRVQLPAENLPHACAALRRLLGAADAPLVLLAERDGATVVSSALERPRAFAQAVVLVGKAARSSPRRSGRRRPSAADPRHRARGQGHGGEPAPRGAGGQGGGPATFTLRGGAAAAARLRARGRRWSNVLPWLGKLELKAASRPSTRSWSEAVSRLRGDCLHGLSAAAGAIRTSAGPWAAG
jgi:hypothetical protein